MTAFDRAWGMVRKSTPLQEEIENQKELGMEVNVKTGDVSHPDMSQALYNLYDYYDQDTGEKIEKSEFNKAWGVVKGDMDAKIARFIKNTSNSGTPYDDYEFDGKVLKVFYKDNVEKYTLDDLKEAGVL
tara:strand:+ start:2949 stop:3335 length:387 start_codon:yes stop_codon:yes gene_type:complete